MTAVAQKVETPSKVWHIMLSIIIIIIIQVVIGTGCKMETAFEMDYGTHAFHCEDMQIGFGVTAGGLLLIIILIICCVKYRRSQKQNPTGARSGVRPVVFAIPWSYQVNISYEICVFTNVADIS